MASYFVPIRQFKLPKLELVLYHSDGGFRHLAALVSLALFCMMGASVYIGYLGVKEFQGSRYVKIEEALCSALVVAVWTLCIIGLYSVWVDDGRKKYF